MRWTCRKLIQSIVAAVVFTASLCGMEVSIAEDAIAVTSDLSAVATASASNLPRSEAQVQPLSVETGDVSIRQREVGRYLWLDDTKVGYDGGFLIASRGNAELDVADFPYVLNISGWGQLRNTNFTSTGVNPDLNQFQLKRGRIIFSGAALRPEFSYYVQLDGRSSSGDSIRLLDYYLRFDLGRAWLGLERGKVGLLTGRYKVPFNLARWLSARELEFADRSMASMFFDVNRSLAVGLYGEMDIGRTPIDWEFAIFNGLVTGGAETGSIGSLDNNYAVSGRLISNILGEWGEGFLADFENHRCLAARLGGGFAFSQVDRDGPTEFFQPLAVDTGFPVANAFPLSLSSYDIALYSVDASFKYRGWSSTLEYYFRVINGFEGATVNRIFDQGFWLQQGYFVIPNKLQVMARWSRVQGNSATLNANDLSSEEVSVAAAWYFRRNHAKLVADITHLDGAPINSSSLDISPGDQGWLVRSQMQFAF